MFVLKTLLMCLLPKPFDKEKYFDDFNIVTLNIPDLNINKKRLQK